MNKIDRAFTVVVLICISLAAISWFGQEFHAMLAVLELLIGMVIGMTIFMKRKIK